MKVLLKILELILGSIITVTALFLGLNFSDVSFKSIPFLNDLISSKTILLSILIVSSIFLTVCKIVQYLFDNYKKKRQLIYKTIGIENTNFIYNTKAWKFKVSKNGEDIMSKINPANFRNGLVTEFPVESDYPKIAEGFMYIVFTLENHGDFLSVVDNMVLEVINTYKMPISAHFNFYKPKLNPEQDLVVLKKGQNMYTLFKNDIYKYNSGEMDKFRLKVQIDDKSEDLIYEYRIIIYSRIRDKTTAIKSDKTYFISTHSGPSKYQVEEKEKEDSKLNDLLLSNMKYLPFSQCILRLKEGNVVEAKQILDKRIEFLKELLKLRRNMHDGDPVLLDCLFFRVHFNLYFEKKEEAMQDISFIKHVLKINDTEKLENELDNLMKQLVCDKEAGIKTLYDMSILVRDFNNNSRGNKWRIITKTK